MKASSSKIFSVFIMAAGCLISFCLIWCVFDNIVNNTSEAHTNDLLVVSQFLRKIFSGNYDGRNLLIDCSTGSHCQIFPFLWHLISAVYFNWSVKSQLLMAALLKCINSLLILMLVIPGRFKTGLAIFAPFIITIQFCSSVSSVTYYNHAAIGNALDQFGLVCGLFATSRLKFRKFGPLVMLAGGIVSSYSCGASVISVWVPVFLSLLFNRISSKVWYGAWLLGFCVSTVSLFVAHRMSVLAQSTSPQLDPMRVGSNFISLLGLPVCPHSADGLLNPLVPFRLGIALLVFLALGIYINIRQRQLDLASANALLLALSGQLSALAISIFRPTLAAWYCVFTLPSWLACAQLFFVSSTCDKAPEVTVPDFRICRAVGLAGLVAVSIALFFANRSYVDKDPFAVSHSLSAESALRNFEVAPTTAELILFRFDHADVERLWAMGSFLRAEKLSCSGSRQVWTMQGDQILETVEMIDGGHGKPYWSLAPAFLNHGDFLSPQHMSLCLPSGASAIWSIRLPETNALNSIDLILDEINSREVSVVAIAESDGKVEGRFPILLASGRASLKEFAGRKIRLIISSLSSVSDGITVIKVPRIQLKLTARPGFKVWKLAPVNTELGFGEKIESLPNRIISRAGDPLTRDWDLRHWKAIKGNGQLVPQDALGDLSLKRCLNQKTNEYSHFFFQLSVPANLRPRQISVEFITINNVLKQQVIPLLPDSSLHTYFCNLPFCGLNDSDVIQFIHLRPVYANSGNLEPIKFGSIGFIRKRTLATF